MEFIEDKQSVVIFSKKIGLDTISTKLSELNGEQISSFFANRGTKIPRKLNMQALVGALNQIILRLMSTSLTKDYFIKLSYYDQFTEYALTLMLLKVGNEEDFALYRRNLWKLLIRNFDVINLLDGEAQYLLTLKKLKVEPFDVFQEHIFSSCIDFDNEFDGYPISNLESSLKFVYSQDEIRKLAKKYDIIIPTRLKKEDLLNYLKLIMKSKRKLTSELEKELEGMTVVQMNSFSQLHKIPISANLKKNELVYLFMFLLKSAELKTISPSKLKLYDFGEKIRFTVDLSVVDNFGRGTPQRVIYLEKNEPAKSSISTQNIEENLVAEDNNEPEEPIEETKPEEVEPQDEPPFEEEIEEQEEPQLEEEIEEQEEPQLEEEIEEQEEPQLEEEIEEQEEPQLEEEIEEQEEPQLEEEIENQEEPQLEEEIEEQEEPQLEEEIEEQEVLEETSLEEEAPLEDSEEFEEFIFKDATETEFPDDEPEEELLDEDETKEDKIPIITDKDLQENELKDESYDEEFKKEESSLIQAQEIETTDEMNPYFMLNKVAPRKKISVISIIGASFIVCFIIAIIVLIIVFR